MINAGNALAVARIPGFHLDMVNYDLMHSLHLGILHLVIGSALFTLLDENYFSVQEHGPWTVRFTAGLRVAWTRFKAFLRAHGLTSHQPKFSVARMTLTAKSGPPVWKGKAGDNMCVTRWLLHEFLMYARTTRSSAHETIASCLWGWVRCADVLGKADLFLTDLELADLEQARVAGLQCYAILAHIAIASGSQLWRSIPKFHYVDHCLRSSWSNIHGRMNASRGLCFAGEDFIGRVVRMAHKRVNMNQLIRKYLLRIHLMLRRGSESAPKL